jgi:hypothetical protein
MKASPKAFLFLHFRFELFLVQEYALIQRWFIHGWSYSEPLELFDFHHKFMQKVVESTEKLDLFVSTCSGCFLQTQISFNCY